MHKNIKTAKKNIKNMFLKTFIKNTKKTLFTSMVKSIKGDVACFKVDSIFIWKPALEKTTGLIVYAMYGSVV